MDKGPHKLLLVGITYLVVVFYIIVQGLTVGKQVKKVLSVDEV